MQLAPSDFTALVEASPFCTILHDPSTKEILWANRATLEVLGFTLEELLPLKAPDMSEDRVEFSRARGHDWLQSAADAGAADQEWAYRSKDGTVILTEAKATLVQLSDREVIMVQFRDIGREQRTRQSLKDTESFLTTLVGHLEEGVLTLNEDLTVTFASPSAGALLGTSGADLQNAAAAEIWNPKALETIRQAMFDAERDGRAQLVRFEHASDAGARITWIGASVQHTNIPGGFVGFLLLVRDITDRVLRENERARENQHLNYLARFTAMGDMATTIEHEIAQPITAAINYIVGTKAMLDAAAIDESAIRRGLSSAHAQLTRAGVIMQSLRMYVTELEQSHQLVDLNAVVNDCLELIRLRALRDGVEVRYSLSAEPLPVSCEKVLTGQVMLNLCFNAIEEMAGADRDERFITVTTERLDGEVAFRVTDHGRGLGHIPDGRVFDAAFTSKADGHGIGLALSHQVIQRQEGSITALENVPNGAIFEFRLPLQAEDETGTPAPY